LKIPSLRVAPGGVVRVVEGASIELSEALLVCPGATVQAGADPVRSRPTDEGVLDGHDLFLSAPVAIVLGTIESRGSPTLLVEDGPAGKGGTIEIEAERLLHAGVIDASSSRGELGGDVRLVASKESYVSGLVRTNGHIVIHVPAL
jgi:hypothetical protein